jgi:hypothetical protein
MSTDIVRCSIQGTLPGGEKWSVNPCFEFATGGQLVTSQELAAAVTAINVIDPNTQVRTMWNNATFVSGVRLEARSYDGTLQAISEGVRTNPINGSGGAAHPFQTAIVTSLRTVNAGANYKGRLYWPATGVVLADATLRVPGANVLSHLGGIKIFLTAIEGALSPALGDEMRLAVWSRKTGISLQVTRLLMGDVLDTQRRRRDAAQESYSEVPF